MNETGFMIVAGIFFALMGSLVALIEWGHIVSGIGIGEALVGVTLLILVNLPSLPKVRFRKAGKHE